MANYILTDTDLTAVADAIRAKAYPYMEYEAAGAIQGDLNNSTWAGISAVAQAGLGDEFWDIGDCKEIVLNGNIGTLTLSNYTTYVFILDFNHPINKTVPDNNIIFGGFKTALNGGKDIALVNQNSNGYNRTGGTKWFNMNHTGYGVNYGGWAGTDFRYDILGATSTPPSKYNVTKTLDNVGYNGTQTSINTPIANTLMAVLPNSFRNVLKLWNRYIDNGSHNSPHYYDADVTSIIDAGISLLSEFEITGLRYIANYNEENHQKQMHYYSNGNSKVRYHYNITNTAVNWWTSSIHQGSDYDFITFAYTNYTQSAGAEYMNGLAPAFKV